MSSHSSLQVGQLFASGDGQVRKVIGLNRWFCVYIQYSGTESPRRGQCQDADLLKWGRLITKAEARQLAPGVAGLDAAMDAQQVQDDEARQVRRDAQQAKADDAFADNILRAVSDDVLLKEVRRRGLMP
jgi:hypothetical protein